MPPAPRLTASRLALALSFIVTLLAALWVGNFLTTQVARFQHVGLDHDEGSHAAPVVQIAGDLKALDAGGFLRDSLAQTFYPFGYSWLAAPVVMAFGATTLTLRTFNAIFLLLAVGLGWAIAAELAPSQRWLAGLVTASLMLTSAPLLVYSAHIYVDTAGLFFSLLALFLYTRTLHAARSTPHVLVGLLVGWAFLIKYPFGLYLIAGIAVSELLRNRAARRWLPTKAQWLMGGTAAAIFGLWVILPGVFAGMTSYAGAHPPDAPLLALDSLLYYPRILIAQFSLAPILGWLVIAGAATALFDARDERLRAWAIYLWVGMLILYFRRALEPRFALPVLPAAFVVAGPLASRIWDNVARALISREAGTKAERRIVFSFGAWLQVEFELKVRRLWAESGLGRVISIVAVAIVVAGLGREAALAWSRRVATYPILLPLTYRTDALAIDSPEGSVVTAAREGEPALYDYIASHVGASPRLALFYGWIELSEPALRWELARRAWPAGRPQDVATTGFYHVEASPESIESAKKSVSQFRPDYVVVYSDARYGGPHMEFNQYARPMRDDLQLVATQVFTPTVIEDDSLVEWLFDNRPLTADDISGRLKGHTKPWPHYVDIFRYQQGAFAADPLPDLVGLLDTPESGRSYLVPPMQTPVGADFGDEVKLLGYDLTRTGRVATFTFYWKTKRWMREPYHVFVHVLGADGSTVVAGSDIEPRGNGGYPMTWWAPGEVVSDTVTLDLSATPAGEYRVGTGLYEFNSGARLPARPADGAEIADGWLPIIEKFIVP
ncbi:MAG: glycosyltransferase family 39 protein [Chloroflexi bacterium]|nr:glycosyltransferase family 39 protein [Chloroflexota bacterium]